MANKIIILEKTQRTLFSCAFWLDVPVQRQPFYAKADATSAFKNATQAEVDAIKAGAIYEHLDQIETRGQNQTQLRATLEQMHANLQAELDSRDTWVRYGSTWDGTTWVNTGVP